MRVPGRIAARAVAVARSAVGLAGLLAALVALSRGHVRLGGQALGMDLLVLAGVWISSVAFHEAGHVAGAFAQGLAIRSVRVACFALARRSPGGAFGVSLVRWQGGGTTVIDARGRPRARRMLVFLLGGAAFNLLAVAAALWLHRREGGQLALAIGAVNAAMLVVNLLPAAGAAGNDGTLILRTLRIAAMRRRAAGRARASARAAS
jgi:hypothetical protein